MRFDKIPNESKNIRFSLSDADFIETTNSSGFYSGFDITQNNSSSEDGTYKFMGISTLLHIAVVVATLAVTVLAPQEPPKSESIVIEFDAVGSGGSGAGGLSEVSSIQKSASVLSEPKTFSDTETKDAVLIKKAITKPTSEKKLISSKPKINPPKKSSPPLVAQKAVSKIKTVASPKITQPESPVIAKTKSKKPVKQTLDDIETPELESLALSRTELSDKEIDEDLKEVQENTKKEYSAKKEKLSHEFAALENEMLSDQEAELEQIRNENEKESRKKQAKLAAIIAAEKSAAATASAERAAAKAASLAKGSGQNKNTISGNGSNSGSGKNMRNGTGSGTGNGSGSGSPFGVAGGSGNGTGGIRRIEQLRQMPGNIRPKYSTEERAAKKEGNISLVAYIGNDGLVKKMKLAQSTGYSSLDEKTISAVQTWKFYPGQEGWVEIPFRWNIKGAAEFNGPVLRTNLGKR